MSVARYVMFSLELIMKRGDPLHVFPIIATTKYDVHPPLPTLNWPSGSNVGSQLAVRAKCGLSTGRPGRMWAQNEIAQGPSKRRTMVSFTDNMVFILSLNSIHFPVVCLATMSLGTVITTTNPINTLAKLLSKLSALTSTSPSQSPFCSPKSPQPPPSLPIILMDPTPTPTSTSSPPSRP
ncbi:hypothetical protein Fmac_025334 [Flemingia macrophylla]|uniref:Uncharacterized protein n=1 Tax=Flemingia macrophylla TaxID=520843 RepID=A0ABD1LRX3_9FABA